MNHRLRDIVYNAQRSKGIQDVKERPAIGLSTFSVNQHAALHQPSLLALTEEKSQIVIRNGRVVNITSQLWVEFEDDVSSKAIHEN